MIEPLADNTDEEVIVGGEGDGGRKRVRCFTQNKLNKSVLVIDKTLVEDCGEYTLVYDGTADVSTTFQVKVFGAFMFMHVCACKVLAFV